MSNAPQRHTKPTAAAGSPPARTPVQVIRSGFLSVSIWAMESNTPGRPWFSITPQRCYKDEAEVYHYVTSFNRDDAGALASLLFQAHAWIVVKEAENASRGA